MESTRGRPKKQWLKCYPNGWLNGSVRWQMDVIARSVFWDLICAAELYGPGDGRLCDNDGRALPDQYLAGRFNVTMEQFTDALEQCLAEGCVERNGTGVLKVTHFELYQRTEYDRQKPYRQRKKLSQYETDDYNTQSRRHMFHTGPAEEEDDTDRQT